MGNLTSREALALRRDPQRPDATRPSECPIATDIGVRVPDVAWASAAFLQRHGETTPFPEAPELCVEIRAPSNADAEIEMRIRADLAAGAQEVWIVSEGGTLGSYDRDGTRAVSAFGVTLSLPPQASKPWSHRRGAPRKRRDADLILRRRAACA